jgi:hypothetical protein
VNRDIELAGEIRLRHVSNVLSEEKKTASHRAGTAVMVVRRIEKAAHIRRETA